MNFFIKPETPALPPQLVRATTPHPPNWEEHCDETTKSNNTYKTFPVLAGTLEYQTISEMISPLKIVTLEQVVNPDLWSRFVSARKELLKEKSDELDLLSKLGLSDLEMNQRAYVSLNCSRDASLGRYSSNEVLLFHCTRSKDNLPKIFKYGLDERVGNGGTYGKGIYLADNPQKSISYDGTGGTLLIFQTLLGDCLSLNEPNSNTSHAGSLLREPLKVKEQMRNFNDHFFDSITAGSMSMNEYVVFNRFRCCLLYQVKYSRNGNGNLVYNPSMGGRASSSGSGGSRFEKKCAEARGAMPTIAWRKPKGGLILGLGASSSAAMPNPNIDWEWPFFAATIYQRMGVNPEKEEEEKEVVVEGAKKGVLDENIATLVAFGFTDLEKNRQALETFGNNLERAASFLSDEKEANNFQQMEWL